MEKVLRNEEALKQKPGLDQSPPLVITRIFDAPVEKVWESWKDENLVKEWWGPEGYTAPEAKIDFREGGKYLMAMQDTSGKMLWSAGVFVEIAPYKKIVMTDHFSDQNGKYISANEVGMQGEWPEDLLITVTFENTHTGQTKMVIRHEGIPKEMSEECIEGWNSSINKLQKFVERQ